MITDHVVLKKGRRMLGRFEQADGTIVESLMRTNGIVMAVGIFAEQVGKMLVAEDGEVIQAFDFDRFHERLRVAVHLGNAHDDAKSSILPR